MKVLEDKENFLLNRREVRVIVGADKNPSYEEASNLLQEQFKVDKENIVVKQVKGKFGRNTFLISAFIYKSKEDKEKFEPKLKKKKAEEKEDAEEKEEAAEKPAEEKTEKEPGEKPEKEPEEKPAQAVE